MTYASKHIEALRFFRAQAGGWVGHSAETAIALARAEQRAMRQGLVFSWEPECEPWDGDYPLSPTDLLEYVCCYSAPSSECNSPDFCDNLGWHKGHRTVLASLGMVATTGYRDPYRRVVEAELAEEALYTLDAKRDELATEQANELAGRATFAGPCGEVTP